MQAEETAQLWPAAGGTSVRTFCRTLVELFVSAFFFAFSGRADSGSTTLWQTIPLEA